MNSRFKLSKSYSFRQNLFSQFSKAVHQAKSSVCRIFHLATFESLPSQLLNLL